MDITNLISLGESQTTEFKEGFNSEALETTGAFANADGGTILIGVKDSGEVCGFKVGKKTIEDMANRIQEVTDPRLQPTISITEHNEYSIIAIKVSAVSGVPVSVRGRYLRRVGKTNQRMSHEEIMQRMISATGLSWDATIEPSATLKHLNKDSISQFISNIKDKGRLAIPKKASELDILRKLELLQDNSPTRAALLLFGNNPETFYSSAFLKLGRFRSPTHIVDDREIHGTIFDQIDGALNWFRERLETEFVITGAPAREVLWEYPLEAIREAVTNAVCHRDYISHAHSQVRLYDDRLEIRNAGCLPTALTPELLLQEHDSIPRNRRIADSLFYAGYIERWGSGTLRIKEELSAVGFPIPKFESNAGHFKLVLTKPKITKKEPKELVLSGRHNIALEYVKEHGSITTVQFAELMGISKSTALRDLTKLVDYGVLTTAGTTGIGTSYRLDKAYNGNKS